MNFETWNVQVISNKVNEKIFKFKTLEIPIAVIAETKPLLQ